MNPARTVICRLGCATTPCNKTGYSVPDPWPARWQPGDSRRRPGHAGSRSDTTHAQTLQLTRHPRRTACRRAVHSTRHVRHRAKTHRCSAGSTPSSHPSWQSNSASIRGSRASPLFWFDSMALTFKPDIDGLTRSMRDQLMDSLLADAGVRLPWQPQQQPAQHHRRLDQVKCGRIRDANYYIGIEITRSCDCAVPGLGACPGRARRRVGQRLRQALVRIPDDQRITRPAGAPHAMNPCAVSEYCLSVPDTRTWQPPILPTT